MHRMLGFVTCATGPVVLNRCLLASPCLSSGEYYQAIHMHAPSAATAFNSEWARQHRIAWLVWVHQDVFLPQGWDSRFMAAIAEAERRYPRLAVVGVYGVAGVGEQARRAGNVLDRGTLLREPAELPCLVDCVDELLFAIRTDSGLRLDPELGFDFYGADVALQAREQGFQVAIVDAYCEHRSATPQEDHIPLFLEDARIMQEAGIEGAMPGYRRVLHDGRFIRWDSWRMGLAEFSTMLFREDPSKEGSL